MKKRTLTAEQKNQITFYGVLCFAFCICIICTLLTSEDFDYWFHYRIGEEILTTHTIPTTAIGSWYGISQGTQWIAHEWLSDILIYLIIKAGGIVGAVVFSSFTASALLAGILMAKREDVVAHPLNAVILSFLYSLIMSCFAVPRPQLFQYILMSAELLLLEKEEKKPSRAIWWMVPITILWVNLHGGSFPLLFVIFGCFIIGHSIELHIGRIDTEKADRRLLKKWFVLFGICCLAVFMNPYGRKMWWYPFSNITDDTMINSISEWQSPNFHVLYALIFLCLLLYSGFSLVCSGRKIGLWKILVASGCLYLALKSRRFLAIETIVLLIFMISNSLCIDGRFGEIADDIKKNGHRYLIGILYGTAVACLIFLPFRWNDIWNKPYKTDYFPSVEMVAKIKESSPKRLFNDYDIGGYLLYHHIDVFVDGRADIYSRTNLNDYLDLSTGRNKTAELLKKYDFDCLLVKTDGGLDFYLKSVSKDYRVAYEEDGWRLYTKR
jgi:hypothetical protein